MSDWVGFRPIDRSVENLLAAMMPEVSDRRVMFYPNPVDESVLVATGDAPLFEEILRQKNLWAAVVRDDNAPIVGASMPPPSSSPPPHDPGFRTGSRRGSIPTPPSQPAEPWRPPAQHQAIPNPSNVGGYVREVVARLDKMDGSTEEIPFGQSSTRVQISGTRAWLVNRIVGLTSRSAIREAVGKISWQSPPTPGGTAVRERVESASRMNADFIRAEKQAADALVYRIKNAPSIVSLLTNSLLANTDSHVLNVKDKIRVLTEGYEVEVQNFSRKVGDYQAFKFAVQKRQEVLAEVQTPEAIEDRKRMFSMYAGIWSAVTVEELEKQYIQRALDMFAPANLTANIQGVESVIKKMVGIEQEIFATATLLSASSRDREILFRERFTKQLADISMFPFVEEFWMDGEVLKFRTIPVEITYSGMSYPLGRYQVTVHPKVSSASSGIWIAIQNATKLSYSHPHPHISGADGTCICWGNIREGVKKIYAEWDFPMLVNIIWSYLHSYTSTDKYCEIGTVCSGIGFAPPYPVKGKK